MLYSRPMIRIAIAYGLALGALTVLVEWLDFGQAMHLLPAPLYGLAVALIFAALGIWLGRRLAPRPRSSHFERNDRALASLGISTRECEVLGLLAEGCSNKVIARRLAISPNTVKTHVARLFEKLGAANRTEAIHKARRLELLP